MELISGIGALLTTWRIPALRLQTMGWWLVWTGFGVNVLVQVLN